MNKYELKSLLENIYSALTEADSPQSSPMEMEDGLLRIRFNYPETQEHDPHPEPPSKPTPQWHWEWDGTNLRYWLLPYTPSRARQE